MKPNEFLNQIDHDRIVAAIGDAERRTSGEIRVYVSHRDIADPLERARLRFAKLGMHNTTHHNAVLLYFAPRSRMFAVIGDTGVHEKCGDTFWSEVAAQLSYDLKTGSITEALIHAVEKIGALLAAHFPPDANNRNELPNEIIEDEPGRED